jgi:hypothetical protein
MITGEAHKLVANLRGRNDSLNKSSTTIEINLNRRCDMGRVKQLFNEYWEEKLAKMETHQRQLELDLAQDDLDAQAWAQHEKDFNAWLDAYEKSFGKQGGES